VRHVVPRVYGKVSSGPVSYDRVNAIKHLLASTADLNATARVSPGRIQPSACSRGSHAQDHTLIDASGNVLRCRKCTTELQHA
jgi:hypothetical protein